jgi:hypothetical protein
VQFNEAVAEEHLDQLLGAEGEVQPSPEKKRRSSSGKRSSERSKP